MHTPHFSTARRRCSLRCEVMHCAPDRVSHTPATGRCLWLLLQLVGVLLLLQHVVAQQPGEHAGRPASAAATSAAGGSRVQIGRVYGVG